MVPKKIEEFIIKYLSNTINKEEWHELNLWFENSENDQLFYDYIEINYVIDELINEFNTERTKVSVLKKIKRDKRVRNTSVLLRYAAVFVIAITSVYFIFDTPYDRSEEFSPQTINAEIEPGTDKAILTLEDGAQIVLGKGENIQTQNASSNGEGLVYKNKHKEKVELVFNYLAVPRGGQFYVELSDGTKVWLNSESKLKYPISFNNAETREVELVYGEAYFDVSPSSSHKGDKFKVISQSQEIEVIGTEFNIKAYQDEPNSYTTLVEGKIDVFIGNSSQRLTPNQQLNIKHETNDARVEYVDVYNEISWKRGVFSFDGKSLMEVMNVLSRWYDFKVVYENKVLEDQEFVGILRKNKRIEEILSTIKSSGIIREYEIRDKTILLK